MNRPYRGTYCRRVKKTRAEKQRELEVEKAAFYASGGVNRSFYERRACPDAFRPPEKTKYEKWRPKHKNNKSSRRNRKKERRAAERRLSSVILRKAQTTPIPQKQVFVSKKEVLKRYAAKLNANVPASEKWFLSLYEAHGLLDVEDRFNEPFADVCIPDIVNHRHKYIIEVQDPTHKKVARIVWDAKKNALFAKSGYRAFYVWAWDHLSFDAFLPVFKEFMRTQRLIEFF